MYLLGGTCFFYVPKWPTFETTRPDFGNFCETLSSATSRTVTIGKAAASTERDGGHPTATASTPTAADAVVPGRHDTASPTATVHADDGT